MKASLTLRDDAAPLLRAKLPVALFSVPCVAALAAGDPADLRLSLATAAPARPSLRLCYAPNRGAAHAPLSLAVVLGAGPGGCPAGSAVTMAVEATTAGALSFSLALRPALGDFAFLTRFHSDSTHAAEAALPSEFTMRSAVPVPGGRAAVRVLWGVRIPADVTTGGQGGAAAVALRKLPFLVLGKVTVERPATAAQQPPAPPTPPPVPPRAEAMDKIKKENEKLRREVGELREAVTGRRENDAAGTSVVAVGQRGGGGKPPEMTASSG